MIFIQDDSEASASLDEKARAPFFAPLSSCCLALTSVASLDYVRTGLPASARAAMLQPFLTSMEGLLSAASKRGKEDTRVTYKVGAGC